MLNKDGRYLWKVLYSDEDNSCVQHYLLHTRQPGKAAGLSQFSYDVKVECNPSLFPTGIR